MKRHVILILVTCFLYSACTHQVPYISAEKPGKTPLAYGDGHLSFVQNLSIDGESGRHYFTKTTAKQWNYKDIETLSLTGGAWTLDSLIFKQNIRFEHVTFIGEPKLSYDGNCMLFVADYPTDIWKADRLNNGMWGEPYKLDVLNTILGEWHPSIASNGDVYFAREDRNTKQSSIYWSKFKNEAHTTPIKVEGQFNEDWASDPCISPDGECLVFSSTRDGGQGQGDLYAAFITSSGVWSQAYPFNDEINTAYFELAPYISPDGKFLFFTRRETWKNANFSNIYWVSMDIVKDLQQSLK